MTTFERALMAGEVLTEGEIYRLGDSALRCMRKSWGPEFEQRGWALFGSGLDFMTGECVGGPELWQHTGGGELSPTVYTVSDLACIASVG